MHIDRAGARDLAALLADPPAQIGVLAAVPFKAGIGHPTPAATKSASNKAQQVPINMGGNCTSQVARVGAAHEFVELVDAQAPGIDVKLPQRRQLRLLLLVLNQAAALLSGPKGWFSV